MYPFLIIYLGDNSYSYYRKIEKKSLRNELRKIPPLMAAMAINESIITNKINGNRIVKQDLVMLILCTQLVPNINKHRAHSKEIMLLKKGIILRTAALCV